MAIHMALMVVACSFAVLESGGCRPNLKFEQRECEFSKLAKSGETLGYSVTVRPRDTSEWHLLVNSVFGWSRNPPRTPAELGDLLGHPTRMWQQGGRPFVSYDLAEGTLQLGLESDRSGSDEYLAWRLRWRVKTPQLPSKVLEVSTFECVEHLLPSNGTIVILDQNDIPRISLLLQDDLVREWTWINLSTTGQN
jgi:hypothetical protein